MILAITGGTGFVGQALIDAALEQGFEVRALARRPQEPREGVVWIEGGLSNTQALAQLITSDVEAVVHVAGVVNAPDPAFFEAGNVLGTMAVVNAAIAAGVHRFMHVSSLAAREPELSYYGNSKLRAERIVQASALDWTIVRPPAVYGPRDGEMLELFKAAKWGFVPVPRGTATSIIYVQDLAEMLLALLPSHEDTSYQVFEADDGCVNGWTMPEIARLIGDAVGKSVKVVELSRGTMNFAAKTDAMLRGVRAKLTADRVGYMTHPDWVVRPEARVPAHIFEPRVSTPEGMAYTAYWYREAGWL